MTGTYNFTKDFEDLLLACYIAHAEEFNTYGQLIKSKYFTSRTGNLIVRCALKFEQQYSKVPSWESLWQYAVDEANSIQLNLEELTTYFEKIKSLDTQDYEYVRDRLILFCKERETIGLVKQVINMIQDGKTPELGFATMFEDVLKIGQNLGDMGMYLHESVEHVVNSAISKESGIATGYPQFDAIWKTGWRPGWLIVPLAPPKRYKSTECINLALNMVGPAVGQDVIYYTLEISQELALQRALCNIAGLTEKDIYDTPQKFIQQAQQKISESICGNLLVKHFALGTASIGDIKAHAKNAIKQLGIKPKAIIIDYADTVRPSDNTAKPYEQQAAIYKEAIALGYSLGCCIIMPDRCNKETVDKAVPDMKSFQGAFAKGGLVDIAYGLCSTEAEYSQNILRHFIFINRHGPAFQHFRGTIDPARSIIDVGIEIPYEPDSQEEKTSRRQKKSNEIPEDLQA